MTELERLDELTEDELAERLVEVVRAAELTAVLLIALRRSGQLRAFLRAWSGQVEWVLEQVRGDGGGAASG